MTGAVRHRRRLAAPIACGLALASLVVVVVALPRAGEREQLRPPAPAGPSGAPTLSPVVDPARTSADALADVLAASEADEARSMVAIPADQRRPVAAPEASEDLCWIGGRVLFPPGTPADERVEVVADGRQLGRLREPGDVVGADERFRLGLPRKTGVVYLHVVASYLYLDEPLRVVLAEPPPDIVLEPALGGRIVGRVIPPAGLEPKKLAGTRVTLPRDGSRRVDDVRREADVRSDLTFELNAVRPGFVALMYFSRDVVSRFLDWEIEVESGRETSVELRTELGARVTGRVLRPNGDPVDEARIRVEASGGGNHAGRLAHAGADGGFDLRGIPPGPVLIVAELDSTVPARWGPRVLVDGQEETGIELVLGGGETLSGSVRHPDGSAARNAQVHLDCPPDVLSARVDSDGRFEFAGLRLGRYTLSARSSRYTGPDMQGRVEWFATAEASAGAHDVVLTLSRGGTLAGSVVDDLGAPVAPCQIRAVATLDGGVVRRSARSAEGSPDGSFSVDELLDGTWRVVATWHDVESNTVEVRMPGAEPVTLTLPRPASISGTVVDAAGAPVDSAVVAAGVDGWFAGRRTEVGPDGGFLLPNLPAGSVRLQASASGFARAVRSVSLNPGEQLEGLSLALLDEATITGELAPESRPRAAREVRLTHGELGPIETVVTDDHGRFEVHGLPAGEYQLAASPSPAEIAELRRSGQELTRSAWEVQLRAAVVLLDGESAHVVLRH